MLDLKKIQNLRPIPAAHTAGNAASRPMFSITVSPASGHPVLGVSHIPDDTDSLPEADRRLLREIRRASDDPFGAIKGWGQHAEAEADIWENPHLVDMVCGHDRTTGPDGLPIELSDSLSTPLLRLLPDGDGAVKPSVAFMTGDAALRNPVFLTDSMVIDGHKLYPVRPVGDNFRELGSMLEPVERRLLEPYLSLFLTCFTNITPEWGGRQATFTGATEKSLPTIVLEKVAADNALYLRVTQTLESSGNELPPGILLTRAASVDDTGRITVRNIENVLLDNSADRLANMIRKSAPSAKAGREVFRDGDFFIIPAETASPFLISHLHDVLAEFRLLGSEKLREYRITAAMPKLGLHLSSGIDFLEGEADVTIEGETFSLSDILEQFRRKRYVQLSDGNRAILDTRYMGRLQRLFNRSAGKGRVKVSFFDLPELESLIQDRLSGDFARHAREVFLGFNGIGDTLPEGVNVNATLRPYQRAGVAWLGYLAQNGLGGCLADDMGLGKTLQAIALLSAVCPKAEAPSLVIMPRSLLFNWENELKRFAPQLSVSTYYGTERDLDACLGSDLILTTYAVVRNDIEKLRGVRFECAILDESQNIKNTASQISQAVALIDARLRFALSGTPMENNLTEIYSLFRFLNPTMFGSLDSFNELYTRPIQKDGDEAAMQALRRKIYPFMLRRVKSEVLSDLPDRIDQTIYVEMSESQRKLYENRRIGFRQEISDTIAREGVAKAQFVMLQALNELRRIASVPESVTDGRVRSPKIDELVDSLSSAVGNEHKCLVFFNYIAGLELTGARLAELGIQFATMTGSSSAEARKKTVGRFQTNPECKVLLMTLKTGGVGLNLTAADTVYIFEPWWNKAAEEQAINRLHRIGQKATVHAFSTITVGTIEEKIQLLQRQKSELFNQLISSDTASSKQLSEEDIDFILS